MGKHKQDKSASGNAESAFSANAIKDSAQQIWQAGLGAFTRAQAEGSKAFEALVKEGVEIQRRSQQTAEERVSEASQKMSSMASDLGSKAAGQWGKLESIFEDRVAQALNKLGMPTARDIAQLSQRIDELTLAVKALSEAADAAVPAAPRKRATKASAPASAPSSATAAPRRRTPRKPAA